MKKILSLVMLLLLAVTGFSQEKKQMQSPRAYVKAANFSVSYGQPSKRGREIFGKLVPYGEVWRAGANEATEITFKKDVMFGDKHIKAGTYTLFVTPEENKWTVILNSELKQWGSFGYDKIKDKDVAHVTVPVEHISGTVEKFTIREDRKGLVMEWDQTRATVPMKF